MIAKTRPTEGPRARRGREPLDVQLTVRVNFGEQPQDGVTVINNRSIPMVNSVFANRDRILRSFVTLLVKTGLRQPKVTREIFPGARFLKRQK